MGKKRAKRRKVAPKTKGSMGFLRGGFKSAVGGGEAKARRAPWVDWALWIGLGLGVAYFLGSALS